MRATYVPAKRTRLTQTDAMWAMRIAFERIEGRVPSAKTLAILTAQSGFETADWESMWNFSLGNAKATEKYEGYFTVFRCGEIDANGKEWLYSPDGTESCKALGIVRQPIVYTVPPGHPQTRFRAYVDAPSGALAHLKILGTWPEAWDAALAGDPAAFCAGLIINPKRKYYTAGPDHYRRNVVNRTNRVLAAIERDPRIVNGPVFPTDPPPMRQPVPRPTLSKGDKLPSVYELQGLLTDRGYPLKVDGQFGPITETAVLSFQRDAHLPPTGTVDAATWAALDG